MSDQINSGAAQEPDAIWYANWHELEPTERFEKLKSKLLTINSIDEKAFDLFDTKIHDDNIGKDLEDMNEEDYLFMVNVSEHIERPHDMLMFLGEFFKKHKELSTHVYG